MNARRSAAKLPLVLGVAAIVAGCAGSSPRQGAPITPAVSPRTSPMLSPAAATGPESRPSATPGFRDVWDFEPLAPLEPGAYFVDPDGDTATPLRVVYDLPVGWSMWTGGVKFSEVGHVGVSIVSVVNLVRDGCRDHSWAAPPIGSSVDELAAGLADLAPYRVTSAPKEVTIYGYGGKHLEWTVPDLPVASDRQDHRFTECTGGDLKSWVAWFDTAEPGDAFYGYTGPGYTEEFWILDVGGARLMIAAGESPGSPAGDVAELDAVLESIRIEP